MSRRRAPPRWCPSRLIALEIGEDAGPVGAKTVPRFSVLTWFGMVSLARWVFLSTAVLAFACTPRDQNERPASISLEDVARYPRPGTSIPRSISFSPDGELVAFLESPDDSLTRELYAIDLETGRRFRLVDTRGVGDTEENLSEEEKLRRERRRERGLGVTRYAWAKKGNRLLVPLNRAVYVQDGPDAPLRKIVDAQSPPVLDARLSPDGSTVAYVQNAELYVIPVDGGEPRQLTRGARGTGKTNGLAEFIAQEEMRRYVGHWWSPDGRQIAFAEVDETHIPIYRIPHPGRAEVSFEDHRYSFAGADNAKVRLGVVSVAGGKSRYMDLGGAEYLARVHWTPDGRLFAELENREQTELRLVEFNTRNGKATTLLTETSDTWLNLNDLFFALEPSEEQPSAGFIWGSERSGFQHLYLYDREGKEVRALTSGDWVVDSIEGVDEDRRIVYFLGSKDGVTERHLYAVSLDGGAPSKITREAGMHSVTLDSELTRFVDVWSSVNSPPSVSVRSLADGDAQIDVTDEGEVPGFTPPDLVTLTNRHGIELQGALYRPPGEGPFPAIVSVYGGPGVQRVRNDWWMTVDLRAQYLRERGYLVFVLDNRGSTRRGVSFERATHENLGELEIEDQVDGVEWLVDRGLADPDRVGIYGWSYGGYLSALALGRAPDTFKAGVAGAPVAEWEGYDTHYTERYMGTPQSNPEGYEAASVMTHVPNQRGKLLIIHGMIDENVHFRHTARIVQSLIDHDKDYELLVFPDERHMPRKEKDRVSMEKRISRFFDQNL